MTDKEIKQQKKRVKKLFDKWVTPLGLRWWEIKLVYLNDKADPNEKLRYAPPAVNGVFDCIFSVSADYYYKTAQITAYLPIIMEVKEDKDLERYFVHELMHILVKPMQHKSKAAEEELVATTLADAFLWVREAIKDKKL